MRVVEDVFERVDILEKKVSEKNKKSDFAIKIREGKYQLHDQALELLNIIILLKDNRVNLYKNKLIKILTEIEAMQGKWET